MLSATLFTLAVLAVGAESSELSLTLMPDAVNTLNARCLDGTPGGYYWRPASNPNDATKFLLVLNGGGWCYSAEDCVSRSHTDLGSSKGWKQTISDDGITNSDPNFNPTFSTWSVAYLYYCDGASYGGNLSQPLDVNGTQLHFRGFAILNAFIQHLQQHRSLNSATHVVLSGHSAGGLGTYMHTDHVRSLLPANVIYGAVPDAGFFLDTPNVHGQYYYTDRIETIANISQVVSDKDCMAAYPTDTWRCMMAEFVFPHITSSLHVIQSSYDAWQLSNVLQLDCVPSQKNCSSTDIEAFQGFHATMLLHLNRSGVLDRPGLAMWSDACVAHSQAYYGHYFNNTRWMVPSGRGLTLVDSIDTWYNSLAAGTLNSTAVKRIDTCEWPCNDGCHTY
eukprot:m.158314 g.158314  ORF g.158314 m.158314 type:complete len:391 (+) comp16467_c0_seq4:37-1209(+)